MKYYIITFGCQMNKANSERIASILEKQGYQPASKINEADLIVVNMCSVRQSAVDRVYGKIRDFAKLKAQNQKLKTILTGCILKEDRKRFAQSFDSIWGFPDLKISPKRQKIGPAYIPISQGCNFSCSYCVIPQTRGRLICRDHREILKEVEKAIKDGYKEIWLLGQIVNNYRSPTDSSFNFTKLLEEITKIPGDFKIYFTSPHPSYFSDELIDLMAKSEKIAKYLNLPVQSGDNEILRKMRRPYTVEQYKNLVKKIKEKIPNIYLSTDIIVGFPGETKKQFENTVKLVKEIKFDNIYIGKYSPRPGTVAFQMKDDISLDEKKKREKILMDLLKNLTLTKSSVV